MVDLEVPVYELPLPEGVGEDRVQGNLSVREIEETWRERLHENNPSRDRHSSQ